MNRCLPEASIDVVQGPFGETLSFGREEGAGTIRIHQNPDDIQMRNLMLQADMAVSGGGQTAYELAATATPTLGIELAENQRLNLQGLSQAGTLINLGPLGGKDFYARLCAAAMTLAEDAAARRTMGTRGRLLVDGHGTERVTAYLKTLLSRKEEAKNAP